MKTFKLLVFSFFFFTSATSQETFIKKLILSNDAESGDQLFLKNDTITLTGYFHNSFGSFGAYIANLDLSGNTIDSLFIEDIQPSDRNSIIKDNHLFLAGNYNFTSNKQKLYKIDRRLNILNSTMLFDSISNYEQTFQLGLTNFDDKFHVSTSAFQSNKKYQIEYIVNSNLKFDKTRILPIDDVKRVRETFINKKSELVYFYNKRTEFASEENGILTYKNEIFTNIWNTGSYSANKSETPRGTQLSDGGYTFVNINKNGNHIQSIIKVSEEGDEEWNFHWPNITSHLKYVNRLIECKNGDIIGMGSYNDLEKNPRILLCAYMFRLDKDGNLLWERGYYENQDGEASRGNIKDLIELDDGSLIVTGEIRSPETFIDILFMKTDSNGCIEGLPCNNTVVITDVDEIDLTPTRIDVYPNPMSDELKIDLKDISNAKAQLYNLNGIQVLHQDIQQGISSIDVSQLPVGMYQLKIMNAQGLLLSERVVKI